MNSVTYSYNNKYVSLWLYKSRLTYLTFLSSLILMMSGQKKYPFDFPNPLSIKLTLTLVRTDTPIFLIYHNTIWCKWRRWILDDRRGLPLLNLIQKQTNEHFSVCKTGCVNKTWTQKATNKTNKQVPLVDLWTFYSTRSSLEITCPIREPVALFSKSKT